MLTYVIQALAVCLLIVLIKGYLDLPYPSSEEGALPPPLADDGNGLGKILPVLLVRELLLNSPKVNKVFVC